MLCPFKVWMDLFVQRTIAFGVCDEELLTKYFTGHIYHIFLES